MYFQLKVSEQLMLEQIDDIQEVFTDAQENILKSKQVMERYHEPKVYHRSF